MSMKAEYSMRDQNAFIEALGSFFSRYDARALGIEEQMRDNFERFPAPGDGRVRGITIHVLFHNIGIFGRKGDYLSDIHPRIAFLNSKLADYLGAKGMTISGKRAQLACAIMPYPDLNGVLGQSLPLSTRKSRGQIVIPARKLRQSPYYARLMEKYGDFVGIVTNNGTLIGPDGGLIAAACGVARVFQRGIRVLEFGSGGGSTALALMRKGHLASYGGNDFSKEMVDYFESNVTPQLAKRGIPSSMFFGSCFDMPVRGPIDLISIGVYYQAQPSLFVERGRELSRALGATGVIIAQTGMIEDRFITHMLRNAIPKDSTWPWQNKKCRIKRYFRYIDEYILEQEIILIATNNRDKFQRMIAAFARL